MDSVELINYSEYAGWERCSDHQLTERCKINGESPNETRQLHFGGLTLTQTFRRNSWTACFWSHTGAGASCKWNGSWAFSWINRGSRTAEGLMR